LTAFTLLLLAACSSIEALKPTIPPRYLARAERDVTLTALSTQPDRYHDKVVILGGVVVEERLEQDQLWVRLKNRPLDDTYRPHRPVTQDSPEAGHFWVTASSRSQFSGQYRHWARITVVGRVVGTWSTSTGAASGSEPVLSLLYAKGWTSSGASHDNAWEISTDPNAIMNVPAGLGGEFGPAP
jgi:starvation-inducible outer membrane lipoprotein